MELPEGAKKTFKQSLAGSVRIVWNDVVREFLDTDAEWLFSTHHDVSFVPETLNRLLSWNKPIVSALVFMRHNPVMPQIWRTFDEERQNEYAMRVNDTRAWFYQHKEYIRFGPFVMDPKPDDALIPIGFAATACTLIHRQVFLDIREKIPNQHDGYWFVCDNEATGGGEDRRFYEYARQVGYEAFVDRSCIAGHIAGDIAASSADFIGWDSISEFQGTGEPAGHKVVKEQLLLDLEKIARERHAKALAAQAEHNNTDA